MTTYTTQPQGLVLWWLNTLDESSPQWVPASTPTVRWGRYDGRPWVARHQRHKWQSQDAMTHHPDSTRHMSSDKHFTKKLFLRTDRGNPLSKRVKPKHVHLMTVRVSTLNWHMRDRGNPLSKQTQKMCQMVAKHVLVMKHKIQRWRQKHFVRDRCNPYQP